MHSQIIFFFSQSGMQIKSFANIGKFSKLSTLEKKSVCSKFKSDSHSFLGKFFLLSRTLQVRIYFITLHSPN